MTLCALSGICVIFLMQDAFHMTLRYCFQYSWNAFIQFASNSVKCNLPCSKPLPFLSCCFLSITSCISRCFMCGLYVCQFAYFWPTCSVGLFVSFPTLSCHDKDIPIFCSRKPSSHYHSAFCQPQRTSTA